MPLSPSLHHFLMLASCLPHLFAAYCAVPRVCACRQLLRRMEALKEEKDQLSQEVAREEDFMVNTLRKKLEQVRGDYGLHSQLHECKCGSRVYGACTPALTRLRVMCSHSHVYAALQK